MLRCEECTVRVSVRQLAASQPWKPYQRNCILSWRGMCLRKIDQGRNFSGTDIAVKCLVTIEALCRVR